MAYCVDPPDFLDWMLTCFVGFFSADWAVSFLPTYLPITYSTKVINKNNLKRIEDKKERKFGDVISADTDELPVVSFE